MVTRQNRQRVTINKSRDLRPSMSMWIDKIYGGKRIYFSLFRIILSALGKDSIYFRLYSYLPRSLSGVIIEDTIMEFLVYKR